MSATPIPRTMIMTIFGDMDTSVIREKPKNRKEIKTYSKMESKVSDVINFVKKQISITNTKVVEKSSDLVKKFPKKIKEISLIENIAKKSVIYNRR